jgi:hypothetical protein
MGITRGGQDTMVTKDFLDFKQVTNSRALGDARFDQMGSVTVRKLCGEIFFLCRNLGRLAAASSAPRRDPTAWWLNAPT